MNVWRIILICHELQDHGHDGDDGGAKDGHGVVQAISRHLGGSEVMDLPKPEPDIDTETSQPEEDGEGGELEEEASDDTSAGVGDQTRLELVPDNQNQEGDREEEEEGDLDGGHVVVPELVTRAVADDDDDDTNNANGHHDGLSRGPDVVTGALVATRHGHVRCLLDAVVVELVQVSVDDCSVRSKLPVVPRPEIGLLSITLKLCVDIGVVITTRLGHILILSLVRLLTYMYVDIVFAGREKPKIISHNYVDIVTVTYVDIDIVFCAAKIDAGFIELRIVVVNINEI